MSRKTRGLVLVVGGALLVLTSLGADVTGMGGVPGFGWKQIVGTVVGVILALGGLRDVRS